MVGGSGSVRSGVPAPASAGETSPAPSSDELNITLSPGQGREINLEVPHSGLRGRTKRSAYTMFAGMIREWDTSPETAELATLGQTGFFRGTPFVH
jgi:hypothetical protein